MDELRYTANGLEDLFEYEKGKCSGILNGIDTEVWDPETDEYLAKNFSVETVEKGKQKNKKELCKQFDLDHRKTIVHFYWKISGRKGG